MEQVMPATGAGAATALFETALRDLISRGLEIDKLITVANDLANAGGAPFARRLYSAWIEINSDHPLLAVIYFNRSIIEDHLGDRAATFESLKRAIDLNPSFIPPYINLGIQYERNGSIEQAIELWQTATSRPAQITGDAIIYATTALTQLARVLSEREHLAGAEEAVRRCLDINPYHRDMLVRYLGMRLGQCKWPAAITIERIDRATLLKNAHPLTMLAYTDDPLLHLASAECYARQLDAAQETSDEPAYVKTFNELGTHRLRVGYVSSDLRDHAIGSLTAELFQLHDKHNIEVFVYYSGIAAADEFATRIRESAEHWYDIRNLTDKQAAELISDDRIDVLVDVNGHTNGARTGIFARRPAPIQVNWLGYPGTLGTLYHQYIIADEWIVPPGSEIYFSEKVVRIPCYQPNDRQRVVAHERPTRLQVGLPEDAFVFCCFNGTHKISRFTFQRWLTILSRVPDSVLWILDTSSETKARLGDYAEQRGVARTRLVFAPRLQNALHLARYPLAHLFLDTTPYGAHTTASDALWMGVPVLTLSGRSFASRVCGSLVRAAGLPDLVCETPEAYVERAIALGCNRRDALGLREQLIANRPTCTLFNTPMLVRRLEELYLQMHRDRLQGKLPQPDLTNLPAYLEAGLAFDHENHDMVAIKDYHGLYRRELAMLHRRHRLHADHRLWSIGDIVENA
jgi:predicted O-linked N-acetylglucosamine transferase (SPINDLY family)